MASHWLVSDRRLFTADCSIGILGNNLMVTYVHKICKHAISKTFIGSLPLEFLFRSCGPISDKLVFIESGHHFNVNIALSEFILIEKPRLVHIHHRQIVLSCEVKVISSNWLDLTTRGKVLSCRTML